MQPKARRMWAALAVIAMVVSAAVWAFSRPGRDLTYQPLPAVVVIYADIEYHGGGLIDGWVCTPRLIADLRVWGDGLAYAHASVSRVGQGQAYAGTLTAEQVGDLLSTLAGVGFFGEQAPQVANPAGNQLHLGVNLSHGSRELQFSDYSPPSYVALIDQLVPLLTAWQPGQPADARIVAADTRVCATMTPAGYPAPSTQTPLAVYP